MAERQPTRPPPGHPWRRSLFPHPIGKASSPTYIALKTDPPRSWWDIMNDIPMAWCPICGRFAITRPPHNRHFQLINVNVLTSGGEPVNIEACSGRAIEALRVRETDRRIYRVWITDCPGDARTLWPWRGHRARRLPWPGARSDHATALHDRIRLGRTTDVSLRVRVYAERDVNGTHHYR